MDYLKQLDDVLEFPNEEAPIHVVESKIRKQFKSKISDDHLALITEKLCRNGYAVKGKDSEWAITYDGVMFLKSAGYKSEANRARLRTLRDKFQYWVLVGAAFAAGLYSVVELLKIVWSWIYPCCY